MKRKRTTITFAAAPAAVKAGRNDDDRKITGPVLPYGVPGRSSAGNLRVRPGAVRIPDDLGRVKLTRGHDRDAPIAYATFAKDTRKHLTMEFRPGTTELAEQSYAECADHLRDAFSVELANMDVRGGWVESADLVAVALLPFPAYEDARALAAERDDEAGDDDAEGDAEGDDDDADDDAEGDDDDGQEAGDEDDGRDDRGAGDNGGGNVTRTMNAGRNTNGGRRATAQAGAPARRRGGKGSKDKASLSTFFEAVGASTIGKPLSPDMQAALSDITHTANEWVQETQFAGELWSGVAYRRRFVPLVNRLALTSYKVNGWRWATPPAVAAWAGDKTAVPSNAAVTEPVEQEAERLAGAHDLDRKFFDFGDTGFIESYYRAMTESYAMLSDLALVADLEAAGTAVAGGPYASLSAGVIAAILALPDNVIPEWAIVGKDLLPDALAVTEANKPAYLKLELNLTGSADGEGTADGNFPLYPAAALNGQVLVGARQAATFYELSESPIRVQAVNMVNGGVDPGVFGYYSTVINNADALQLAAVTP
jgi:hypothetical protein